MMFSGGPHAWVVGLYIHNGKKAFEVMTEEDDHKLYAMNVATISGKSDFILMGPYYSPDAKVMKDASQGIGAWTMNSKGKVTAKNIIPGRAILPNTCRSAARARSTMWVSSFFIRYCKWPTAVSLRWAKVIRSRLAPKVWPAKVLSKPDVRQNEHQCFQSGDHRTAHFPF